MLESIGAVLPPLLILTVLLDVVYTTVRPPESGLLRRIYFFGQDVGLPCLIWNSCLLTFAFLLRIF